MHLSGSQQDGASAGRVTLDGNVLAIDAHTFTLVGRIVITDTPDARRRCVYDGTLVFWAARAARTGGCTRWTDATK